MKIYFAGSIRGGRVDAELYHRMIEYMKRNHIVLTEHVGSLKMQESASDQAIYARDMAWLKETDMVIAECTCPSLGVGYELAYAEKIGKPCYIFYDKARTDLSAMLSGDEYFHIYPYEAEEEIYPQLDRILQSEPAGTAV